MIAIIPAAGKAERFDGLPKCLLPVPQGTLIETLYARMKRVPECTHAAIGTNRTAYAFLRQREGISGGVFKAETQTMSETVMLSRQFVEDDEPVLFGMADTYFEDENAFVKLAAALDDGADVAVGVFMTRPEQRSKLGMCRIDDGRIIGVADKQPMTDLEWAWGVLAWKPSFWQYIQSQTPHVGYAIPLAAARGLDVRAVKMDGGYWDCGVPDEYFSLIRRLTYDVRVSDADFLRRLGYA